MSSAKGAALVWELELPDRRGSTTWGPKPRASLLIAPGTTDEERLTVPVSAARLLAKKEASGEIHPQSRAELLYLLGESCRSCARSRIERLIDRREYTEQEMRKKLKDDGYSQKVIDECVGRACEAGLVSDARYADSFIRAKAYAGWGMSRISRELSRRGIDVEQVEGWPYEYLDPEDELERAVALAQTRRVGGARAFEKLVRFLCARGYRTGVAVQAARRVMEQREESDGE